MRSITKKVTWMARTTTTVVGLAIMLALVLGVASSALAGTGIGARFDLGKTNTVNAVTKLVGSVAGPSLQIDNNSTDANATALDLQVEADKAPMKVNSDAQVANLNSDKLDGKSANEIGVNGLTAAVAPGYSGFNSASPKSATVSCPAGKVLVEAGYEIDGGNSGNQDTETDVVVTQIQPFPAAAIVEAHEEEPTSENWFVKATATCATGP